MQIFSKDGYVCTLTRERPELQVLSPAGWEFLQVGPGPDEQAEKSQRETALLPPETSRPAPCLSGDQHLKVGCLIHRFSQSVSWETPHIPRIFGNSRSNPNF